MNNNLFPCLWYNQNAPEAAIHYQRAFPFVTRTASNPFVEMLSFEGQQLMLLNGGPEFRMNGTISFYVVLESEADIDNAWKVLSDGGKVLMALDKYPWSKKYGWVEDQYGANWQLSFGNISDLGQKLTPVLMFTRENAGKAEESIAYYSQIFPDSSVVGILRWGENGHEKPGTIQHGQYRLNGSLMMTMDSSLSDQFSFNEGVSLVVNCKTQEEIDHYWNRLSEGGSESRCGWLKDKYGVSWQIVPEILGTLMGDPVKSPAVVNAFMKMNKFIIKDLLEAAK